MKSMKIVLCTVLSCSLCLPALARPAGVLTGPSVRGRINKQLGNEGMARQDVKPLLNAQVKSGKSLTSQTEAVLSQNFPGLKQAVTESVGSGHADLAAAVNNTAQAFAKGQLTVAEAETSFQYYAGLKDANTAFSYISDPGTAQEVLLKVNEAAQSRAAMAKLGVILGTVSTWPAGAKANVLGLARTFNTQAHSLVTKGVNKAIASVQAWSYALDQMSYSKAKNLEIASCKI